MTEEPSSPAHPWALGSPTSTAKPAGRKPRPAGKQLLRRMAAAGGWIEPVAGHDGEPQRFRIVGKDKTGPAVGRRTLEDWRSRGWIVAGTSGVFRLTAAGHEAAVPERAHAAHAVSPHRRQHGLVGEELRTIEGSKRQVTADAAESPLGWLMCRRDGRGRPLIEEAEYAAGERLRADFTIAGLSQRITSSWGQSIASGASGRSGGPGEALVVSERAMDARRRVNKALAAVGPGLAGILLEVCCLACGLEAAERRLGLPQRAGKVILQIALARLAEHYGLSRAPAPQTGPVRVRSWGSQDYRPALFATEPEEQRGP